MVDIYNRILNLYEHCKLGSDCFFTLISLGMLRTSEKSTGINPDSLAWNPSKLPSKTCFLNIFLGIDPDV
ncbi:hypothetical protein [Methanobacterium formicicum]|uniref:hypothetical protein n=1 Tax=Methanobacterium formicicum TaxID=2162 RepID=UPI00064F6558|nr:hypothetical protein [Methanobacterium formicicum]MDH2659940.1 hypothetical protein [Methanobacterium formicicum]